MTNLIDVNADHVKTYATEANLDKALARTGLDSHPCRRMKVRNADGGGPQFS